jgi:uncharacterized FlaG/YvyC family protein
MEVNLPAQLLTPQSAQQQPASQQTTVANQVGATQTVQAVPDQVVTAATDPTATNTREDDALRRQERPSREPPIATLEDLQVQGLTTRIDYDTERERVFLEILAPRTNEVLQRIPSENLLDFLATQIVQQPSSGRTESFDRSV